MSVLAALGTYLRGIQGLEGLRLDTLGPGHGAVCLRPVPVDPVVKTYLDGSSLRQELYYLWARRAAGGGETPRQAEMEWLETLARTLEKNTRQGALPALGPGKRAWSLRAVDTAAPEILQENGLLVDQITLKLEYFMEG